MKKLFCLLLLAALLGAAAAESLPELTLVTPMPSAAPAPTEFACEAFIVNLPAGMQLLDAASLAGYEAAAQALFPSEGRLQFAAVNPENNAALSFSLLESVQTPLEAAQEAALHISGSAENAAEAQFGANSGARFSFALEDSEYCFCYFTNGSSLLLVCAVGLEEAQLDSMLSTLDF